MLAKGSFSGTVYGQGAVLQEPFGKVHHPIVVLVGDIDFHRRKLWIMCTVHPFVAEVFRKLVYTVKTADNQSL